MLNVTSFNIGEITSKVSLNTPSSGIIQRSHPRSKFVRFHSRSPMSEYASGFLFPNSIFVVK